MKIGYFVSLKETGGSLNQTKGFLNNINNINSEDKLTIITDDSKGIEKLKSTNIEVLYFKKSLLKKFYFFLIGFLSTNKFFSFKTPNPFEIFVKKNNIDLLIFSNPSFFSKYCENIDYVINIWNTEINDYASFIEFKNGNFQDQKKIIKTSVENAFRIVVFTNQNKIDLINQFNCNPEKIVISPGPCTPNEAGISIETINKFSGEIPILGICLGHQSIGQAFGGKIIQAKEIMHGKTSKIIHQNDNIFSEINNPFIATRYHSLVIEKKSIPDCLEIIAWTKDEEDKIDEIMAVKHKEKKVYGVQFHPESIASEFGHKLLDNFLNI